jgi:pterin-4a-carbinolamine dehydratase
MLAGHALSVTARSALPQLAALQRVPCSIWGRVSSRSRSLACRMSSTNADELRAQSCSLLGVCSSETPLLPAAEVTTLLAALPAWALSEDGRAIKRRFVSKNFVAAVTFFTRVSEVAEAEGHHPDLHLTNYRDVEVGAYVASSAESQRHMHCPFFCCSSSTHAPC